MRLSIKNTFLNFTDSFRKWVKESPDDAMVAIALSLLVMIIAVIFTFISIRKEPRVFTELPIPSQTKDNGWVLKSRNRIHNDICDTYQKGVSYQVRCYAQNENGKWYLKDVF